MPGARSTVRLPAITMNCRRQTITWLSCSSNHGSSIDRC